MGDEEKEYWEVTQNLVQPLIPRPQLTEKLLKKPPFRFMHDIFTNLTAQTGFGEGLLQGGDLDSSSFSDKAAKATCLRRIVTFVSLVNKRDVVADPKQMVSGKEPEKSNLFLQDLAHAVKVGRERWYDALEEMKEQDMGNTTALGKSVESDAPPPPPPDEESNLGKIGKISVDTRVEGDGPHDTKGKPLNWDELIKEAKDLRSRAGKHGADVDDCKRFSNRELGSEILDIQKEIDKASKTAVDDPLSHYDLPDVPDDVDNLVQQIEDQLSAIRTTNEMIQSNEQVLDRLTKGIIPH